MSQLKIRFRLNPGRTGAPMDKLGDFTAQAERFLRSLTKDLGVEARKGQWLALQFSNGSVEYDCVFPDAVPPAIAAKGINAFKAISGDDPVGACNKGLIGFSTLAEFAKLGKNLDPDESYYMHVYGETEDETLREWREVPYHKSAQIRQLLEAPIISHGSLQGMGYSWTSGTKPPFFHVRELVHGELIKCNYDSTLHSKVHEAFARAGTILHVFGDLVWDKPTNSIIEIRAKDIQVSKQLSPQEFEKLSGSMPNFTGDLSTSDYIEWLRSDD